MIYQIDRIVEDVRICMDHNMKSESLIKELDIDTLSLDEIIKSKIVEAVQKVHLEAPNYLLEGGYNFGDALYWGDKESGWVLLPDDFMRLVVFEMDDWERPVYTAISSDDTDYEKQRGRVKALRGTPQRPVCVLGIRPEGKVLEFYSCKNRDAQVSRGIYLPYPLIDKYGGIDISKRCYNSVVYLSAGLTAMTYKDTETATSLMEMSKSYM